MAGETQAGLKGKLATKAQGGAVAEAGKPRTMEDEIKQFMTKYGGLLPDHIKPERMMRIVSNEYRTVPKLRECAPASFYGAVIKAVQLGLEPGVLGHCYLLPYRRSGQMEVQLIIGYKGMIDLIRRSGQVMSIVARPVYSGDKFVLQYGLDDKFEHTPYFMIDGAVKGDLKGVSLFVKFKDGGYLTDYMPVVEIEEHRQRSLAKDNGPWKTDYEAMALKTIIRKNFKWLPVSIEIQTAVGETDERLNKVDDKALTVEYEVVDESTGEIPMSAEEVAAEVAEGGSASSFDA